MNSIKFINRDQPGSDLAAGVAATFASYSLVYLKVNEDDAKDYLTRVCLTLQSNTTVKIDFLMKVGSMQLRLRLRFISRFNPG